MKKNRRMIRLLVFMFPALITFSSFAQGVIKAESGARIVSETGSYWVVDNGAFTLTSPGVTNPAYTFSSAKTDDAARFLLHFGGTFSISENAGRMPVTVYSSGNTICIASKSGSVIKGGVTVYNMIGQPVMQQQLGEIPFTRISLSGATGYYLVKVVTGDQVFSGKVFIK